MRAILPLCAAIPERAVPAGETIIREGERSGALHVLRRMYLSVTTTCASSVTAEETSRWSPAMTIRSNCGHTRSTQSSCFSV